MNKAIFLLLVLIAFGCNETVETKQYAFEGEINEEVLRNYLSRAITMAEICVGDDFFKDYSYPCREDDIRLISNIKPKFIGRAAFRWGEEDKLMDPEFFIFAANMIERIHEIDPEIIFQASIFEIVTTKLNQVKIPARIFQAFKLPVEDRTFNYSAMLNHSGRYVNHWGQGESVPDITNMETKLWFYFLATSYIDAGFEAIHWGQVALIGMEDEDSSHFYSMLNMVRGYAREHARRKYMIFDAHTPNKGIVKEGHLLFDFHSFPLRIKENVSQYFDGKLEVDHIDALYRKSKGGITPSGWKCENLPYLVEFDNFGISPNPGEPDTTSHFIWGYDEITWLSLQPEEYRLQWLEYAYNWMEETDPDGYLQMPVCRVIVNGTSPRYKFKANTKSESCPEGISLEEKIKELWSDN